MPHPPPFLPRSAAASDTLGIHALIAGIYAQYHYTLDVESEDTHLIDPGRYFRASGGDFWVIPDETGRIIASGAAAIHSDYPNGPAGELKSLYVDPSARRRGFARTLANLAIAHSRDSDCSLFILWSDTIFTEAHNLYRSLGMSQGPTRHLSLPRNSFDEYFFSMPL